MKAGDKAIVESTDQLNGAEVRIVSITGNDAVVEWANGSRTQIKTSKLKIKC